MRVTTPAILLFASLSSPVLALDFGNGFSLNGNVELEYLASDGDDFSLGWVDATLGWRSQAGGAVGFGFDLALDGAKELESGEEFSAFWGGLVVTTAAGDFTVGAPRPVLDVLYDTPKLGGSTLYDLQIQQFSGPLASYLVKQSDVNAYGISFIGTAGDLRYGVYYSQVEGEDADIVQVAGSYRLGNTLIQGGAEVITLGSSDDITTVLLAATHDFDRFSIGAALSDISSSGAPFDGQTIKLFGDYQVTDALTLGVQIVSIDTAIDATLYGVSGEYGFGRGGYARLGAFDSDQGSDQAIFDAAVGFRF
ncbi:porin [Tabrizicola sp.]|uniref:porin n=1 Tax=Tabrizicola sp. TaxID=2005166 RepID=UPI002869F12D|nr:hypothetical protein [Tabrizicola sp.]